jgi:hypothetical protein
MRVFIAFPFSQYLDNNEFLDLNVKSRIESILDRLTEFGHDIFLAHMREDWGNELMTLQECTPLDLKEMHKVDMVLAFPGSPISGGVHID